MALKGLKGLFVKDDAAAEVKEPEQATASAKEAPVVETTAPDAEITKMVAFLNKSLAGMSKNGAFDYLKFRGAVNELKAQGSSEDSAIKSVFVTAKTMGLNKKDLIADTSKCLAFLVNEKKSFTEELNGKKQEEIANVEAKIKDIEKQLSSLGKEKDRLEKALTASKAHLNVAEFAFNEAVNSVTAIIKADADKINTLITGE